jgi:hypothetical protein
MQSVFVAWAAVLAASFVISSASVAFVVFFLVASLTVSMFGWIWMLNPSAEEANGPAGPDHSYGVDINAVSVVNLVTAGKSLLYDGPCDHPRSF